jgi:hypothetical protein
MKPEQLLHVLEALQRRINDGFEEAKAMIGGEARGIDVIETSDTRAVDGDVPVPTDAKSWNPSALDTPLPSGAFDELNRLSGVRYDWPDGNIDIYDDFVVYRATGGLAAERYALGHKSSGEKIGFSLGPQGEVRRGITYFQLTDDHTTSDELISYIRGGGKTGKGGFGPADTLPRAYESFKTEPLVDRIFGKWNRLGVVAKSDDTSTMLAHTALQARLRRMA